MKVVTIFERERLEGVYQEEITIAERRANEAKKVKRRNNCWFLTRRYELLGKSIRHCYLTLLLPQDKSDQILVLQWIKAQAGLMQSGNKRIRWHAWKMLKACPWNKPINPLHPPFFLFRGQYVESYSSITVQGDDNIKIKIYNPIDIEGAIRHSQHYARWIFAFKFGQGYLSGTEKMLLNRIIRECFLQGLEIYCGNYNAPNNCRELGDITRNDAIAASLREYGFPYNFRNNFDVNL